MIQQTSVFILFALFLQFAHAAEEVQLKEQLDVKKTVVPSDQHAFNVLMQGAQQGNGFAQYNLGYRYATGEGVQKDDKKAAEWFAKAAEQGVADAQIEMAEISASGTGVAQSHQQAIYWYTRAAEQGHSGAQFRLGQIYEKGEGVAADAKIAHAWYAIAASKSNAQAAANLGKLAATMKAEDVKLAERIADDIKAKIGKSKNK